MARTEFTRRLTAVHPTMRKEATLAQIAGITLRPEPMPTPEVCTCEHGDVCVICTIDTLRVTR